jgi:cell division protease FtsH
MPTPIKQEHHFQFYYIAAAFLALMAVQDYLSTKAGSVQTLPYSQFQDMLHTGKLDNLVVTATQIEGSIKAPEKDKPARFTTNRVDPALAQSLAADHVTFSASPPPGWLGSAIGWVLPLALFWGVWFFLRRKMASGVGSGMGGGFGMGGLMNIGRSRARVYAESETSTRFADVAGADEAKDELMEIVEFLKAPERYGRLGAHVPKGVLLVGPPGTGKTLLARAVAGESGVPFFSISGSEFVEMIVGVGASRVRDMFKEARAKAPAIIFIDEIDTLGGARSGPAMGGHDEKEQTLNQLLSEMDGFDATSGLVIIGATNRPEVLDPALLRPGRFDRQVLVDRPDRKGRAQILDIYMHKVTLAPGIEPDAVAQLTPGFTGADLANLVNEAALLATRHNAENVTLLDFEAAIERLVAGLEKRNRLLSRHEREIVAHHEMGHAIAAMALPDMDPVHKISIIPHGIAALGFTMQRPMEEHFLMSKEELVHRMVVLLSGRAAEELIFDQISTGASDDLVKTTDIARGMVVRFGMDKALGQVAYEPERRSMLQTGRPDYQPRNYSEDTAASIDHAVRSLVEGAYHLSQRILAANESLLRQSAADLLRTETLAGEQLDAISMVVNRSALEPARLPRPATAE